MVNATSRILYDCAPEFILHNNIHQLFWEFYNVVSKLLRCSMHFCNRTGTDSWCGCFNYHHRQMIQEGIIWSKIWFCKTICILTSCILIFKLFFQPLLHRHYFHSCTAAETWCIQNKQVSKRSNGLQKCSTGGISGFHTNCCIFIAHKTKAVPS